MKNSSQILDQILRSKRLEVDARKALIPISQLEGTFEFKCAGLSLTKALSDAQGSGIIAEFKRQSPSSGVMHTGLSAAYCAISYRKAGAVALSVLTDKPFFGGECEDLLEARRVSCCPILRKDFIFDEYQVVESKSIGADVVLLIASVLDPTDVKRLCTLAHSLDMEVLLEVHSAEEVRANLDCHANLLGVNNRDLKSMETTIQTSLELASLIPGKFLKISESGIRTPGDLLQLSTAGYQGFLIGSEFMRTPDPGHAAGAFIQQWNGLRRGMETTLTGKA